MALDTITVPTYEQIATILTKLATNYSNLASVFYDVFYNTTPKDVTFQMYDESGVLVTYTIPNRAKDLENLLSGQGNPEGEVEGSIGVLYQDLLNGDLYIKETENGTEGWSLVLTKNFLEKILLQGNGDPNGSITASKGMLYIDVNSASLYIKGTDGGNTDWALISASTANLADVDLNNITGLSEGEAEGKNAKELIQSISMDYIKDEGLKYFADKNLGNLTSEGESHFANPDLSNLSEIGNAKFTRIDTILGTKEDKSNKVTSLSSSSTDDEYPSAKCVYDLLGDVEALINAL